ncbi:MAG: hypothetical protein LQ352_008320, partial [Teloschistes flavicans]
MPVSSSYRWEGHILNEVLVLLADGTCDVQLYLTGTPGALATIAHASGRMIKAAAQSVLDKCVATRGALGGVASNI